MRSRRRSSRAPACRRVARAARAALGGSVALIDRSSAVLAVAASSSAEEAKLLAGEGDVETRAAGGRRCGRRAALPGARRGSSATLTRMVSTLLALELERSRAPEWASDEAAGEFVRAVLGRKVTDRGDIVARAAELAADVEPGGAWSSRAARGRRRPATGARGCWSSPCVRCAPRARARLPTSAGRAIGRRSARSSRRPSRGTSIARRRRSRELAASLPGFHLTVARSRWVGDPVDLYRAGQEALLAANVAEADGLELLAFEDTGSYRLLLPAMSEDAGELERFYEETVAPLSAYDEQYETELVATIEAYLENDGNVTPTAAQLFTHRHTVRYRLERVRELCGHDLTSTEGREKLGLGLKAMRVLGISPPRGPALEPGTEAGRAKVRHNAED